VVSLVGRDRRQRDDARRRGIDTATMIVELLTDPLP
jgi:hypothetical protein